MNKLDRRFWIVLCVGICLEFVTLILAALDGRLQGSPFAIVVACGILPVTSIWALRPLTHAKWWKVFVVTVLSLGLPPFVGQIVAALQYN